MAKLSDKQVKEIKDILNAHAAALAECPKDTVRRADCIQKASYLGRDDLVLDQCAAAFYSEMDNAAFAKLFIEALHQTADKGLYDLIAEYKREFDGSAEAQETIKQIKEASWYLCKTLGDATHMSNDLKEELGAFYYTPEMWPGIFCAKLKITFNEILKSYTPANDMGSDPAQS